MKQSEKIKQELAKNLKTANSKVSQLEVSEEMAEYIFSVHLIFDLLCGLARSVIHIYMKSIRKIMSRAKMFVYLSVYGS